MKVHGTDSINVKTFAELELGDVFCFIKDIQPICESINVYIRGAVSPDEFTAMNASTGVVEIFKGDELVEKLSASIIINGRV